MIKKYSLVLVVFLCFVMSGFGQGSESFNFLNASTGSYTNDFYTGDNGVIWTFGEGRRVTSTYNITGTSIGFNKSSGASGPRFASANSGANGVGTLNYSVRSYFGGGDANERTMEVYVNGTLRETFTLAVMGADYNRSIIVNQTGNVLIEFRSVGTRQIVLDNISWTSANTTTVDFCNVQSPVAGNTTVGTAFNVYAQVYKAGVTEAAGPGAGIQAWIGYSTSNNNPSSSGWTWVPAVFNVQVGNNDEWRANIGTGPTLPSGTYYYASRFRISGGPYSYGGLDVGGGNGFWDGINDVSGVLSVNTVDFANLQFPEVGTIPPGGIFDVYGQVYEQGVTPGGGQGANIFAQVGYSTSNTNPNTWTNWLPMNYNPGCTNMCNSGQNDEYVLNLGASLTTPATYYYATRYRLNGGVWLYGGILADGTAGNFWDGTTYISGVVNVVAPRIDVERNTNATIPNGSAASTGFNTVFAAETIGDTSSGKTFFIHNEGTANLTVTSIASSNATEFPVTLISAGTFPLTIAPGTRFEFEIAFAPNSILPSPTRTSLITVRSNDSGRDPYTFNVRGTANCAATALTIHPISGPVNTVVTVQGSNFGAATTANFNGTPVSSITVLSSTLIEVTVPSGATTGSLEVLNQIGCRSSAFFTVLDNLITSCQGSSASRPSDLFISEVTDKGSGSHSYIEIYNGTGGTIDLTAGSYQLRIHNNGNPNATASINLTGNFPNNQVRVIAIGGSNAMDPEGGHTADFFSGTGGVNDDDNIRLYKGTGAGTWVDLWGDTTGTAFTIASKDYVYRRKNSGITVPSTTWNPSDWDAFTPVEYSNIGTYDFSVGIPPSITVQPVAPISSCDLSATLSVTATEGFSGGQPLTYQWYVSAPLPAATTWTAISNGGIYSGATSPNLTISNTLNLDNYQYYCQVRENTATCYTASNAVRIKIQKSIWNGTTWSPAAPTISTIAVIDGDYDMRPSGANRPSFSACQLLINPSALLTIGNNKFVEVENNITVNGDIFVESQGSFVQNNGAPGLVNGAVLSTPNKIIVEKETAVMNNWYEYTYWSSPVVGETIGQGLNEGQANRRFWYNGANFLDSFMETGNNNAMVAGQDDIDDDNNDWTLAPANMVMAPGVGYASTLNSIGFMGSGTRYKFTFEGPFNNGTISVPIYRNDSQMADNNWNFIGNPYPSAINVDAFLGANSVLDLNVPGGSITGAIFLWSQNTAPSGSNNGNEHMNFSQSDYAIINGTGQVAGGDNVLPTRFIPSGQGFFVSMANGAASTVFSGQIKTANVVFNNSMRVKDNNNLFFRNSETGATDNKLWLNLTSNNGVFNQILVGYVPGATDGKDSMYYDAAKNLSSNANTIIYTLVDSEPDLKLGIQGKNTNSLNLDESIQLGFFTSINEPTNFRLSIGQLEGDFLNNNSIYLKDNLLNVTFNLSSGDYVFSSETGEFNERFEIVFRDQALSVIENELPLSGLTIIELPNGQVKFSVGNHLNINAVEIIDMLGRTLYRLKGNHPIEVYELSNLSQAAYMAKVTLSNGQVLTKKAVKRK